jgi:hypothetical protein
MNRYALRLSLIFWAVVIERSFLFNIWRDVLPPSQNPPD